MLDQEIESLLQYTNKMDDKNFYASFSFLNESFTLNEAEGFEKNLEELEKISNSCIEGRHKCVQLYEFREGFGFLPLVMATQ